MGDGGTSGECLALNLGSKLSLQRTLQRAPGKRPCSYSRPLTLEEVEGNIGEKGIDHGSFCRRRRDQSG